MKAQELKTQLESFGCQLFLDGDNIGFRFQGKQIPDNAKPLLQELKRYKNEVISILNNTANTIWRNPYPKGTPEARQESLLQIMMAILEPVFARVAAIWPRGFVSTPEIRAAELEVEKVQSLVLSGKARISDFHRVVEYWELMVNQTVSNKL